MGDIVPYRSPQARDEWTATVGMIVFLGSWAMMFGALFFSYGLVRAHSPMWPPPDLPTVPLDLPAVNTVALGLSSSLLQKGLSGIRQGRLGGARWNIAFATLLGAVFLGLQMLSWTRLYEEGLVPSSGTYASVFYALTWFHAAHVAIGIVALAWICVRAFAGFYTAARHLTVRLWTMYWHFVGVVWAIIFIVVYLV